MTYDQLPIIPVAIYNPSASAGSMPAELDRIVDFCGFGGETFLENGKERPIRAVEAVASIVARLDEAERALEKAGGD